MDDRKYPNDDRQDENRLAQKKPFVLNIDFDDDFDDESAPVTRSSPPSRRPAPAQQPRGAAPRRAPPSASQSRYGYPIPRTRVIQTREGERYEIPDDEPLRPRSFKRFGRNNKSRGCLISVVYAIIVCSISALLSFYVIVGINDMFGLVKEEAEIVIEVPEGADLNTITRLLDENGVVNYPFFFKLYAQIRNHDSFKHGTFTLNSKSDYDMIIRKLTRPATSDGSIVKVLIAEGKNIDQIASILEYNEVCDKDAFYKTLQEYEFKHEFMPLVNPNGNADRIYRLEGYLFPATYTFYLRDGSKNAINRFLNAFQENIMDDRELNIMGQAALFGRTVDDIITIASIIERECPDPEEMKNVASVFYNRLANPSHDGIGGKLQSDATRWYPFPTKKDMMDSEILSTADKNNFSGIGYFNPNYQTIDRAGLPAGPICNPGKAAIYAACHPNSTNYYYFFSDNTGVFHYAVTYDEFNNQLAAARANGTFS